MAYHSVPRAIQLTAGRHAQEFNQRKKRKGAYWEDRYRATAIKTGKHRLRCLVYINLNMVRTGVVSHPAEWAFGGYSEIQSPRRKCILIDYEKLAKLSGCDSYTSFLPSKGLHIYDYVFEIAEAIRGRSMDEFREMS